MESLTLVCGTDEWPLPDDAWMDPPQLEIRRKASDRACQHGTVDSGDGKVDERDVSLTFYVRAETQAEFFSVMDEVRRKLYRRDQRLYVTDSRYINLKSLYKVKEEFVDGFANRWVKVEAGFKATDPFFYTTDTKTQTVSVAGSGTDIVQTISVDNIGNADTPPVITVTAPATAADVMFELVNSANSRKSRYADPNLTMGASLVMNTGAATVDLGGKNALNNFTGTFQVLEPGVNVFTYTGGACIISITYTPRYM